MGLHPHSQGLCQASLGSSPLEASALLSGPVNSWGQLPAVPRGPLPCPGPVPVRPAHATSPRWHHKAIPEPEPPRNKQPLPGGHTPPEPSLALPLSGCLTPRAKCGQQFRTRATVCPFWEREGGRPGPAAGRTGSGHLRPPRLLSLPHLPSSLLFLLFSALPTPFSREAN